MKTQVVLDVPAVAAPPIARWGSRITAWWAEHALTISLLTAIIGLALFLRWQDVNWDEGQHLHPDERFLQMVTSDIKPPDSIGEYFDSKESPLNPYNSRTSFVYGTFPLFLNKAVAEWLDRDDDGSTHRTADAFRWGSRIFLGVEVENESGTFIYDAGYNSQLIGRVLSSLFDVATVVLVFLLGRLLWDRRVGLLAAGLLAVTVLHIQYSNFFGSETFLTFFVVAVIYFSVRIWKYGSWPNYALAGLAYGLALATKLNAIPVLIVPALAVVMRMWPDIESLWVWALGTSPPWRRAGPPPGAIRWSSLTLPPLGGLILLFMAGLAFRIAQPYAFDATNFFDVFAFDLSLKEDVLSLSALMHLEFLKPTHYFNLSQEYRNDIGNLLNQQTGTDFPPNIQWIDRTPFIFPLSNIVLWGLGLPLALAVGAGMTVAALRIVRQRDFTPFLPLVWTVVLFLFVARGFNPTMRYFLPIYPSMVLLAALGLVALWDFAGTDRARNMLVFRMRSAQRFATPLLRAVPIVLVLGAILWSLAFTGIYRQDISRVQATHWIAENIPAGAVISSNEWDDGLPLGIPGSRVNEFEFVRFQPYAQDSREKVEQLVDGLVQADYVVESSNRVYDSVTRVPARYPSTTLYYEHLFNETLGFEKVAEFTNYPRLFGIEIPDQGAEEAFTVYDHPKVTIWQKTDEFSRERALTLLNPAKAEAAIAVPPKEAGENALLFRPEVLREQQAGGTWSSIFDAGNFINQHPLFFWLLAIEIAAFSLVPLAIAGFRALPDRGFLLTKPLGILGLAYLAYATAAFGGVDFTRAQIAGVLAFMVAVGAVSGYYWRAEIVSWVRERWRFLLIAESVFLLAFLASYWLRLQNPDLWHPVQGGEKPMDFAYLNGVIRTTDLTQGPIDPWYAGGYLNYYWFGQFIAATVTKLTGIVPEVAYNLIVPMFFALAAAATFSIAYNLTEATRRFIRRRPDGKAIGAGGPIMAALLAVFLVLIAGNLRSVEVLERALSMQSTWHSDIPVLGGAVSILGGLWAIAFGDGSMSRLAEGGYDWWAPSRALDVVQPGAEVPPITEFPYWTFLFADLHAHLMAIPFALAAIGVGLGAALNFTRLNPAGENREHVRSREIASWAMVVVLAVIIGSLRWINSWDYPPFLLLGAAALIIGELAKERRFTLRALTMGAGKALVMGVLSYLLFATIADNYSQSYNGFHQSDQTTALGDYLSHFGVLLFFAGGLVLFFLYRAITRQGWLRAALFGRARRRETSETMPVMVALVLAGASLVWVGTTQRWGVTVLALLGLAAVVVIATRELRRPRAFAPVLLFVYAMIALGLGLSGGVEVLTLDGDIGRMNTVFKFYLHVWLLWGIAGAFALWYIFAVARPHDAFLRRIGSLNASLVSAPRWAFAGLAAVLLVMTLTFPYFGTRARIHDRFNPAQGTGNDGLAFMLEAGPYDNTDPNRGIGGVHHMEYTRDAITWVREHIDGTPTSIEAVGPSYRSLGSRFSIYTGLPTVIGWDFHQRQQRVKFSETVTERLNDVNEFYSTTDIQRAREIIRKYEVEWVFVGDEERFNYPESGIEKFYSGLGGSLELAYQNPEIQIWRVIPEDELRPRVQR